MGKVVSTSCWDIVIDKSIEKAARKREREGGAGKKAAAPFIRKQPALKDYMRLKAFDSYSSKRDSSVEVLGFPQLLSAKISLMPEQESRPAKRSGNQKSKHITKIEQAH